MYLDNERTLYKTFGLRRSLAMVYNKVTVAYYGGLKAEGKPLHKGINFKIIGFCQISFPKYYNSI